MDPEDNGVVSHLKEFNFGDDFFRESRANRPKLTRSQKRQARQEYAVTQLWQKAGLELPIAQFRELQWNDTSLETFRKRGGRKSCFKQNGLWYHKWTPKPHRGYSVDQLLIPMQCRQKVLQLAHSIPLSGHMGRDRTLQRIQQRFYWPSLFQDVDAYCRTCPECQRVGIPRQQRVPLVPLPIMKEPFERIAIDMVGPLPRSRKGYQYVLVICDYATRYPETVPLRTTDAHKVAEELIVFFSRMGIPREILSDQGTNFMSQLLKEIYRLLHVHPIRTTPYHPQTDGLVERFNKTLKAMLKKVASEEGRDWDTLLPYILFAYREVPQATTGFSPFELVFGREVRGPLDVLKEGWEANKRSSESVVAHVLTLRERLESMTELAAEHMREAQEKQKVWYDRNARMRELKSNDQVLILLPTSHNKLLAKWQGPYKVLRRLGKVNYEVDMPGTRSRKKVLHINLLKKWQESAEIACMVEDVSAEDDLDDIPSWRDDEVSKMLINEQLTTEHREQLEALLGEYQGVFKGKPGRTNIMRHFIHTTDSSPVKQRPYRLPHAYWDEVKQELRQMLAEGIIEPSQSDWASPIVLVRKKDGSIRLCVDYRKLNAQTKMDAYPMPRIEDILDRVGKAKFISTIDLTRGYWQVPLATEDKHKTAFTSPFGLYQFCVMPFGLNGAPATFQRLMNEMVRDMEKFVHAYLDDLVIFSDTWEEHLSHLGAMLEKIQQLGLTAKMAKCQWAMSECSYLGHVIGSGRVKPEINKVECVRAFPIPQTKKDVRSFLGLTGYYRRFIKDYASLAAPLTDLTKKNHPETVVWSEECSKAFNTLKSVLTSAPILSSPDFGKTFILQTDASNCSVGAVLSQVDSQGLEHPVAYFSRKLLDKEKKYSTIEKECLAIKLAVQAFQVYLLGRTFLIQTDHRTLQWLDNVKDENSRLARWSLALQPYQFKFEHRKGQANANADTLSRVCYQNECCAQEKEEKV